MNRIRIWAIAFLLFLVSLGQLGAQNLTSQGTDFWFGFMRNETNLPVNCNGFFSCIIGNCIALCSSFGAGCPCTQTNSPTAAYTDITLNIYVSANTATSGTVIFPNGATIPFSVAANSTTTIPVNTRDWIMTTNEVIENKGIRVVSNDPVNVYYLNYRQASSDATIVIPRQTLRGDYYVMAHAESPDTEGVQRQAEFLIVAPEDNTEIQITLPPGVSTAGGRTGSWTITLNAGQSYQVRSVQDLTGTYVSSLNLGCKPFALFGGNEFTRVGNCGSTRDHLVSQMYPTATWGLSYVTLPFFGRNGDFAKIIPLDDNTEVRINGTLVATLNRQQQHFELLTQPSIIEGNKPIAVGQFARTQGCDNTVSDPFFVNLSAVEQLEITDATFSAFNDPIVSSVITTQYINIYTPNAGVPTVRINGVSHSSSFIPLTGTPYSYARISVPKGNHRIQSDSGFVAFLYGWGNAESYGYAGGVVLNNLNLRIRSEQNSLNKEVVCAEEPVQFSSTSIYTVSDWEWDFGDGSPVVFAETPQHTYEHPGTYFVKLKVSVTGACGKDSTIRTIRVRKPRYELANIRNNSCRHTGLDSIDVILNYRHFSPPLRISLDGQLITRADSNVFKGLRPLLYNLRFEDAEGCLRDTVLDLRPHVLDSLRYTGLRVLPVSCYGGNDGRIRLAAPTGGTGRYRLSLNSGTTWTAPFTPTPTDSITFSNLSAGSYTLWLQDDSVRGCILPHPTPIVVLQPDSLVAAFDHTEPDCGGSSTVSLRFFDATGGSGAYAFSIDGGSTWTPMTADTLTLPNIPVGLRNLRIRDAALTTCVFPVADTLIAAYNALAATVTPTPLSGCGTADGSLAVSNPLGGSGAYEYSLDSTMWQGAATFANLTEGSYTAFIRDASRPACALALPQTDVTAPGGVFGTLVVLPITACAAPWDGGLRFDNLSGGSGTYECSVDDGATWEPLTTANNPRQGLAPGSVTGIWMRDANNPSCRFRLRDRVDFARPDAVAVDNDTLLCAESTPDFQPRQGLPLGGTWSSPDITGVNPVTGRFDVAPQTPGNTVRLVYSHPVFCADTFEVYLSPHPSAAFVATPPLSDTLFLPNATLTLALPNYVPGETVRVMWGDGNESVASAATFMHNYGAAGSYPLRIEVTDANTCQTLDGPYVVTVVRPLPDPRVPNTFTPNGDGVNDTWRIELDNTRELQAVLHNRWGFEVWNARAEGNVLVWDGRTASGVAPAGVYFYRLEFKLVTGETRIISGSLTLLR